MLLCGFPACAFRAADRGCEVSTRPSLRPLGLEGGVTRQTSGEMRRENAKACAGVAMRVRGLRCLPPEVVFILERRFMIRKKAGDTSRQPNNKTPVLSASRILRCGCNGGPPPGRPETPHNRA